MFKQDYVIYIVVLMFQVVCFDVFAEEVEPGVLVDSKVAGDKKIESDSIFSMINTSHEMVSNKLESWVVRLDRYFADESVYSYTTDSYLQSTSKVLVSEYGGVEFAERLRLKVDLPHATKRLKFLLETDPAELQSQSQQDPETDTSFIDSVIDNRYYASLQYLLDRHNWQTRSSLGVKSGTPLDPFFRFRFTVHRTLWNAWLYRFDEELYWFHSTGFGSDSSIKIDRRLAEHYLFRSTSLARKTKEKGYFEVSQVFSLFHSLNPKTWLSYQAGAYRSDDFCRCVTGYLALFRWRKQVYREWMFLELSPRVEYLKINDWHPEYTLLFNFEMIFGKKYMQR